jgi:hypothetical protein
VEQNFGDSGRMGQFARPTESPYLLEKSVLRSRRDHRESGFGASSAGGNSKNARTTRNSRNLDRQENEALGDDWAAPVY